MNNFQGRYIITHPWEGEVACENPVRGNWGGPPGQGRTPPPMGAPGELNGNVDRSARTNLGFLVAEDIPAISVTQGTEVEFRQAPAPAVSPQTTVVDRGPAGQVGAGQGGCAGCAASEGAGGLAAFGLLMLVGIAIRRRRT